ncbi:hypothetical protein [Variovorax sp. J22R115]|uniref:hypothetical protein n=1 Tax=Variovorax sp. J22R115 TaxID=3053509 RepID=UPI0025756081|nr:hypothetical protein [Variovorax sp. J22R115]MDM0051666.1 hypothetical protein [Variovorax sp. J22R115]
MVRIRSLSAGIAIGAAAFLGGCVAPGPYYAAGGYPYYVEPGPVVVSPSVYVGAGCCWGNYWGGGYWGRPAYWGGYYGRPYYGYYGRGSYYGHPGYYGRGGYYGGNYARGGGYYGGRGGRR